MASMVAPALSREQRKLKLNHQSFLSQCEIVFGIKAHRSILLHPIAARVFSMAGAAAAAAK